MIIVQTTKESKSKHNLLYVFLVCILLWPYVRWIYETIYPVFKIAPMAQLHRIRVQLTATNGPILLAWFNFNPSMDK